MNEDKLKEIFSDLDAMGAPVTPPSQREWQLFRNAIAAGSAPAQILGQREMRVLILKLLSLGIHDRDQILEKLGALGVRSSDEGEGQNITSFAFLEDEGDIIALSSSDMSRRTYGITKGGWKVLEYQSDSVRSLSPAIAALWKE